MTNLERYTANMKFQLRYCYFIRKSLFYADEFLIIRSKTTGVLSELIVLLPILTKEEKSIMLAFNISLNDGLKQRKCNFVFSFNKLRRSIPSYEGVYFKN